MLTSNPNKRKRSTHWEQDSSTSQPGIFGDIARPAKQRKISGGIYTGKENEELWEPSFTAVNDGTLSPTQAILFSGASATSRPASRNPRRMVTSKDVLAAASNLVREGTTATSMTSDTESEYNYLLGPPAKRKRKVDPMRHDNRISKGRKEKSTSKKKQASDNGTQDSCIAPSSPDLAAGRNMGNSVILKSSSDNSLLSEDAAKHHTKTYRQGLDSATLPATSPYFENERKMITLAASPGKQQKVITGYPAPNEPFPKDFTLTELCRHYPNHLVGVMLIPFLQHGWSAGKIVGLISCQDDLQEDKRIARVAMDSRLKRLRRDLKKAGRYEQVMAETSEHEEGL